MTNFMYRHVDDIKRIGDKYFAQKGELEEINQNMLLYIYLVACRLYMGQKVLRRQVEKLYKVAKLQEQPTEIKIFFEKLAHPKDILYFLEVAKKIEKEKEFLDEYKECIANAA